MSPGKHAVYFLKKLTQVFNSNTNVKTSTFKTYVVGTVLEIAFYLISPTQYGMPHNNIIPPTNFFVLSELLFLDVYKLCIESIHCNLGIQVYMIN